MLVKLVEVKREMRGGTATLSEIYVNSTHIISVTEDVQASQYLVTEAKRLGLHDDIKFSKVTIAEGSQSKSLTVVGSPPEVYGKIKQRQVLRG